jgi:predicted O-methyltransferase YrrM
MTTLANVARCATPGATASRPPMDGVAASAVRLRDNAAAHQRLEAMEARSPDAPAVAGGDAEFRDLLRVVRPYTMLSEQRLHSLFTLAKRACEQDLPGNFAECGVAAGGSSALLAYVLKRYSKHPRRLFAFDPFSGMPAPTAADTHAGRTADATGWGAGTCAAPERSVREACARVGAADVLTAIQGRFEDTLPVWRDRVGMLSLLHLDGDWYESTRTVLAQLYDRVSDDGLLQVEDYGCWAGCRQAIHEFEASRGLSFALSRIDGTGVCFAKPDRFPVNPELAPGAVAAFREIDPVPMGIEGQMSANERFQLYEAVSLLPRRASPVRFVEIGSFAGASLALTYMALKRMVPRVAGFCVEPGTKPELLEVLRNIGPEVTHLRLFSHDAVPHLARAFADGNRPELIFVDGDHSYEGVRRDILDYYPLLAPGGIIAFHDWLPPVNDRNREAILAHHAGKEPGIRQACSEVLEQGHGLRPIELPLLAPSDPTQTQPHLPIIPGVFSTVRAYQKPFQDAQDGCRAIRTGRSDAGRREPEAGGGEATRPSVLSESEVDWVGVRFLDPLGRTFLHEGKYHKAIYPEKVPAALSLLGSHSLAMLQERGFVPRASQSTLRMDAYPLIIELETEYFSVDPRDWGPLMIKDAALAYCDINLALCEQDLGLHDGHKGNFVIQRNSAPRWCDLGSIGPVTSDGLTGVDEFIQYFVYPLLIRSRSRHFDRLMQHFFSSGCTHDEAKLLLGQTISGRRASRRDVFLELKRFIEDIPFEFEKTLWSDYQDRFDFSSDPNASSQPKDPHARKEVLKRLIQSMEPAHVIDFGANAGYFSIHAARCGAEVIAYELDEQAASKCHLNFRRCSPDLRMKVARSGFQTHRHRKADLVLALALTHHLFFTHRYSFEALARILSESTTKFLVTEYMPNGLGVGKPHPDPIPPAYALPRFLEELSKRFTKVECIDYVGYQHRKLIVASK